MGDSSTTITTTAIAPTPPPTMTSMPVDEGGLGGMDLFIPILIVVVIVVMLCVMIVISKRRRRLARQQHRSDPLRAVSGGVVMNVNAYRNYQAPPPLPTMSGGVPPYPANTAYDGAAPPSYDEVVRQAPIAGYGAGVHNLAFAPSMPNLSDGAPAPPAYSELPPQPSSISSQSNKTKTDNVDEADVNVIPKPSTSDAADNMETTPSGGDSPQQSPADPQPSPADAV